MLAWALCFPLLCHALILAHAWIHNATHGNFPRAINRAVGEALGAAVITRFASWEIVHQRHHRYSDDPARDPHPVQRSYWRYALFTVVHVEKQLQRCFFDLYGDTPANRAFERKRAWVSYLSNVALLALWFRVLGPWVFGALFVPANVVAALHVIHFNWATHNASSDRGEYGPVNLDRGYFWWGNRLWHGIYFHANHHRRTNAFNPMRVAGQVAQVSAQSADGSRSGGRRAA
jgi:fatty-acid desaturase